MLRRTPCSRPRRPGRAARRQGRYAGTPARASAVSATATMRVAQRVTVFLVHKSVGLGKVATFYGQVSPIHRGELVKLQIELPNDSWVSAHASATTKMQQMPNGQREVGYIIT